MKMRMKNYKVLNSEKNVILVLFLEQSEAYRYISILRHFFMIAQNYGSLSKGNKEYTELYYIPKGFSFKSSMIEIKR